MGALSRAAHFWNEWGLRVVVLSSFSANAILFLFAGVRRHRASGWRILLLWLAYQLADLTATYALGNLSLSRGTVVLTREHELVAFWAPFLLLHLGGPDNISAYALEDNKLSLRQGFHLVAQVAGASYVLYKHVYLRNSGTLIPASFIMLPLAVTKYIERVCALRRGDLRDIRSSSKRQQQELSAQGCGWTQVGCLRTVGKLGNDKALMLAHKMFHLCKRAMVDSSVDLESTSDHGSSEIFEMPWTSMSKVVEMELSLMYDILYTKASVVYTWGGYLIRFISPLATTIATLLFWIYPKDGQRRGDVIITYILLVAAFLLDLTWLVRALGSTWTFAFLNARPCPARLQHALLCTGRWRRLHRVLVSLDPCHLVLGIEPSGYRLWPSTIGRYNMLHECTRDRGGRWVTDLCTTLATTIGLEDTWNEFQHSRCLFELPKHVKELVFERIKQRFLSSKSAHDDRDAYSMKDITTLWGDKAFKRRPSELQMEVDFEVKFGREFQEDILVWHIGTCIFLSCADQQLINKEETGMKPAIEALSEYLMFLVAVRRHMLPGLALRSLFEVTLQALGEIWVKHGKSSISSAAGKEKLAEVLRKKKNSDKDWGLAHAKSRLLADGAELAFQLLNVSSSHNNMSKLLELIFDVWVDKLLFAGTRCTRESHAKQLSRGGELTTIVWIIAEHAGPFRIGETSDEARDKTISYAPKEPQEKKKEAEENKRKEEERKKKQQEPTEPPEVPVPIEAESKREETRSRRSNFATLYSAR
ncbi:hypothetical protein PR202_ga30624 [Eleusine coracana subsp. coracana]|uniref:DUF4220 domain-containing protein n=1 Tax=Eleusine coracana subsp. coracana TaxID=191504 RepID=A0AAV5DPX2_ELECO|nr:hypothetical protein QOZ80_8AG0618740 [Eleusine coracana subsp. coracana]GJN12353.1 hypothetical protein PR202_ga30624 [Eleusine coracana subsp. coracana]